MPCVGLAVPCARSARVGGPACPWWQEQARREGVDVSASGTRGHRGPVSVEPAAGASASGQASGSAGPAGEWVTLPLSQGRV